MDYAFAPGGTRFDRLAQLLLGRMPNTTVIQAGALARPAGEPNSFDVAAFINHLNTTAAIASHGRVSLDAACNSATTATSEILDQAVANGGIGCHSDPNATSLSDGRVPHGCQRH